MTKAQIKVFEDLLQDKNFKGKKELRHLLWLNTEKPKFNVGDKVYITESDHRLYGKPVINFIGIVKSISTFINTDTFFYEVDVTVQKGDKEYTTECHAPELRIKPCKAKETINIFEEK